MKLFDTNILIFAHNSLSPKHEKAKELILSATSGRVDVALAPQNILEFYSVITNPRQVEKPISPVDLQLILDEFVNSEDFTFIYPGSSTLVKAIELAERHGTKKANIFDTYLVATMLDNGVRTIYTDNEKHFRIFKEIEVINPFR